MFATDQYELLDFGGGRKLERFGPYVLDRPSPAARRRRRRCPNRWIHADARFERIRGQQGRWVPKDGLPSQWLVQYDSLCLLLKPSPVGHLGLFPEHAANWDWIAQRCRRASRSLKILNLFAYTGGATLVAAAHGAAVTHVDAAQNIVRWARDNAQQSRLTDAPIRWITEDAVKFVRRELRRQNRYDAVILDPPSYGHGPKGESWKIDRDLSELLAMCAELLERREAFLLLTCHSPSIDASALKRLAQETGLNDPAGVLNISSLGPKTAGGRQLPCGISLRWQETGSPS